MVALLENALLLNCSLFLIFSAYSKILSKVFLIIGIVLWFLINILKNKKRFYRYLIPANPLNRSLLIFLIAAILSTAFSQNLYHSQKIFLNRYLIYIIFAWLGCLITKSKKNLNILIGAVILGSIVTGLGGILDYQRFKPERLYTTFGININLSFYLIMVIPLNFMVLFFIKNKFLKAGALVATLLLLPCFIWNASRSAWVAGVFSVLFIIFIKERRLALILVVILIIANLFLPQSNKDRVAEIVGTGVLADRPAIMESAFKIFKDYPVLGAGPGMYEKLFSQYYVAPKKYQGFTYLHAHSTYLEVMAEMGIIGLLAFLGIFTVFLINAFKTIKTTSGNKQVILLGLTGSIIATLILSLAVTIITVGVNTSTLFWFLFGMGIALILPQSAII